MAIDETFPLLVASATLKVLSLNLVVEVGDEFLGGYEDSVGVLEVDESLLTLIESDILFLYEFLLLGDVFLDFVQEKVDGLLLVILDLLELIQEPVNVLRRSDGNVVFLALLVQELELSLGLFTLLDLLCEG